VITSGLVFRLLLGFRHHQCAQSHTFELRDVSPGDARRSINDGNHRQSPASELSIGAVPAARAPVSEYDAPPVRVLVHDPAETRALERLLEIPAGDLAERSLFRAHPDPDRFAREHAALVASFDSAEIEAVRLADVVDEHGRRALEENPNHVYTRDAAITFPWLPGRFMRGAMRQPVRRGEPDVLASALGALGLEELRAPHECFLEGGDVIPLAHGGRRALLVGYGPRSSRDGIEALWRHLHPWALDEIVGIEIVPERMNLDGVLVPVTDDTVILDRSSIVRSFLLDASGARPVEVLALLCELGLEPIEVTREEAAVLQACNCFCLGGRRVIAYELCERVAEEVRARDIEVRTVPGHELIKGTGGPRCMTRPLYC
jgi:N-dimethylarginine dimethylaminohydrolase